METLTEKRLATLLGPNALDPGAKDATALVVDALAVTEEERAEIWFALGAIWNAREPAEAPGKVRVPRARKKAPATAAPAIPAEPSSEPAPGE